MAKKKKAAPESVKEQTVTIATVEVSSDDVAGQFVGQWNRLVSTTNWEKGRIICQWREALELAGASVTAYSDEAWAQLVGGVTSQHVGRLRRVFQRFGAVFDQYEGLYWSHFQTGLDWDDAEMWLEGAIRNHWSVSQMCGKRWETLGHAGDPSPDDATSSLLDDDAGAAAPAAVDASPLVAKTVDSPPFDSVGEDAADEDAAGESAAASADEECNEEAPADPPAKKRNALAVDVDDLPNDLADAFEQFKLAIIAQRRAGWHETTPAAVIECLDALKELALAPADD